MVPKDCPEEVFCDASEADSVAGASSASESGFRPLLGSSVNSSELRSVRSSWLSRSISRVPCADTALWASVLADSE